MDGRRAPKRTPRKALGIAMGGTFARLIPQQHSVKKKAMHGAYCSFIESLLGQL